MRTLQIFDTTLRDGEQAAGGSLTVEEKLYLGQQLERLGVDILEAGFPRTSPGDFRAVQLLAEKLRDVQICALSGFKPDQVEAAWGAIKEGEAPRIHVFISSSDIHLERQLRMTRQEVRESAIACVQQAVGYCSNVEFSAMDATRSDWDFLCNLIEDAIQAGAKVINVPDTMGYTQPDEFAELLQYLRANTPGIENITLSVHCHNDLGQANSNSLIAILNGVDQIECTINGVGERAGNASLEEVVMNTAVRKDFFKVSHGINTEEIYRTSRMVSELMNMPVQPNKAVVGANAFAHSSGLHQDGMLKDRQTYEIMTPQSVGMHGSRIVLGKTSGRHAFRDQLAKMGYHLNEEEFQEAFDGFKDLADKRRNVTARDIEALLSSDVLHAKEYFHLDHIQVSCGDKSIPTATVRIIDEEGRVLEDAALGDGPVDAVCKAINRLVNVPAELTEFRVQAITEGIDAQGEVSIRLESDGVSVTGYGADTDIIVASAKAYMNALNKHISAQSSAESQENKAPVAVAASEKENAS